MTISNALSNALSGLLTNQRQADITAHNIANATTPGFSHRDVEVNARVIGGEGGGVKVTAIQRQFDLLLTRDSRVGQARLDYLTTSADAFTRVAEALGDADAINGLPQLFQKTEEAFRALETTPESVPSQQDTLRSLQHLTRGINEVSGQFAQMRGDADAAIAREVNVLNHSLQQLAKVNREIAVRTTSGADTADLEDQRDQLIDDVARRVPVRVLRSDDSGTVTLLTHEGVPLLQGAEPATIAFNSRPVVNTGEVYDPTGSAGPGFVDALSGLTVDGRDIAPGSGDIQSIGDGLIAGLFRVRDEIVPDALAKLDAVAYALTERFQDSAVDPSLGAGDTGLFTDAGNRLDTGDPAALVGLASRIAVNDALDPAAGGTLSRLRDGAAAATPGYAGDPAQVTRFIAGFADPTGYAPASGLADNSLAAAAREFTQLAHQDRTAATSNATAQQVTYKTVSERRLSQAGVNVDEELQRIALYERSFAANSQVIQTATRMLDDLLGIVR
ncbi:MAG: flagellar hook-associated protein FlgK [Alphaproteobacteria bacterium]|nr:flagellar hook-associated protein FlgK [Alphaproteobacteria bacterium]MCB9930415.1 flagellar hook-associated protein FlgK [Alphaproteobacteria bacterium]